MVDQMFLRSGLAGLLSAGETWIAVAYVTCMFVVLAFRPQQIADRSIFRISYIMFALYFVIPSGISAASWLAMMDGRGQGDAQTAMMAAQLSGVIGRIFLAIAIVLGLASMNQRSVESYYAGDRPAG